MTSNSIGVSSSQLLEFYRMMQRIRQFEEAVARLDEAGQIRTPCHYCIGQEAPPTGVCAALERDDAIFGAHRSHGHYLAKGGDLPTLMAEIFCRASGCSSGRGGSMHINAPECGVLGTVPIVAATIPVAVGAGLAAKLNSDGRVAVAFFGDGATEEGHFHESLNLAGVQNLPVIFVCENNLYSSHMGISERRREDNIPASATAHGLPGIRVDGNDVVAVHQAAEEAVQRARRGDGPTLLECRTFRWRGHVGPAWDMDVGVKRKDELKNWLSKDPLLRCFGDLVRLGINKPALEEIRQDVQREIEEAIQFAQQAPHPELDVLSHHVYRAA